MFVGKPERPFSRICGAQWPSTSGCRLCCVGPAVPDWGQGQVYGPVPMQHLVAAFALSGRSSRVRERSRPDPRTGRREFPEDPGPALTGVPLWWLASRGSLCFSPSWLLFCGPVREGCGCWVRICCHQCWLFISLTLVNLMNTC